MTLFVAELKSKNNDKHRVTWYVNKQTVIEMCLRWEYTPAAAAIVIEREQKANLKWKLKVFSTLMTVSCDLGEGEKPRKSKATLELQLVRANQYIRRVLCWFLIFICTRWFILMKRKCRAFFYFYFSCAWIEYVLYFMHLWRLLFHSQGLKTYAPIRPIILQLPCTYLCICTLADCSSVGKRSLNMFFNVISFCLPLISMQSYA